MNDFEELISRAVAASAASDLLQPAVSAAELAQAERKLGFRLHPLLAALYRRVGNGGFGPSDSVLPLSGGPDADWETSVVQGYLDRIPPEESDTWWSWPEGVVPVLDWGCAMFACVDCRSDDGTVLLFEPNAISGQDVSGAWFVDAGSLAEWLGTWLDGRGWYEEDAVNGGFPRARWAAAASRLQSARPADIPTPAGPTPQQPGVPAKRTAKSSMPSTRGVRLGTPGASSSPGNRVRPVVLPAADEVPPLHPRG
ncbi:SMI1/KNR4 family protein [Kitasatospora indigofera]|uniref:SMI1/KNR4 family protein n=1 Tax=Kitasatospora indigofera TaxID=67307 RepID=UPI0033A34B6A